MRFAVRHFFQAGHNLEQRGLAHAVRAHNANLRAGVEAQRHVVQNHFLTMGFTRLVHLVDKLCHEISFIGVCVICSAHFLIKPRIRLGAGVFDVAPSREEARPRLRL